jgi:hypothetical protein
MITRSLGAMIASPKAASSNAQTTCAYYAPVSATADKRTANVGALAIRRVKTSITGEATSAPVSYTYQPRKNARAR